MARPRNIAWAFICVTEWEGSATLRGTNSRAAYLQTAIDLLLPSPTSSIVVRDPGNNGKYVLTQSSHRSHLYVGCDLLPRLSHSWTCRTYQPPN